MTQSPSTAPITDSVTRVNHEVAVGEDLDFQRKWWKFENAVWIFFVLILILDLAGVFGRGPLSKAHRITPDGSLDITYERIERTETPSIITVRLGPTAIRNGHASLFVSQGLIRQLGTQRVMPTPESSLVGHDGITYTFAADKIPATIDFGMEPTRPGIFPFIFQVPGSPAIQQKIIVMP